MKTLRQILLFTLFIFCSTIHAQDNVINEILLFPQFKKGIITFNNGNKIHSQLNYNTYKEEMIFVDKSQDTLAIANPTHIAEIKIEEHTFEHYKDGIFFEKVPTHTSDLYIRWKSKSHNKGKKMPYGGQINTTSSDSWSIVTHPDNVSQKLQTNEGHIIEENYTFYVKEDSDFKKLDSAKALARAFNKDESAIKEYTKRERLNIKKSGDMRKTIEYIINTKQ